MKIEKNSDDLWTTQRSLSTFTTFAKGQDEKTKGKTSFTSETLPRVSSGESGPSSSPGFSLFRKNDETGPSSGGKGTGNFSATFPRRGGGVLSKAKAVSVPLIPLKHGNMAPSPLVPRHAQSKSLIEECQPTDYTFNTSQPNIHHSHSNSLSFPSDSSTTENGWSLDGYLPNHDDVKVLRVTLELKGTETRFGFSVIGGLDEGFPPCIDEIFSGSPADKADLEVGDEILEVNGRSLEDATHTEVISHIHQCIRSRTICLRVKRRSGNKLALDLASQSNVQDAFVIAVEQQARDRLEKLSALKRIKPVDMTKLSQQLSEVTPETSELNGLIEAATGSPIYVTSLPVEFQDLGISHPVPVHVSSVSENSAIPHFPTSPRRDSETTVPSQGAEQVKKVSPNARRLSVDALTTGRSPLLNGHKRLPIETCITAGKSEIVISEGQTKDSFVSVEDGKTSGPNSIVTGKPRKGPRPQTQEDLSLTRTGSGDSISGSRQAVKRSRGSKTSSRESLAESSQYANMTNMVDWDNGPHREMAVDVPESFIPRNKTPPRYPPSSKTIPTPNHRKAGTKTSTSAAYSPDYPPGPNGALGIKLVPPSRTSDSEGWTVNNNNTQPPQPIPRTALSPNKSAEVSPSMEQADRIKKYQEDLRKRREQSELQAQEEEFLRTSLRGSKKLQALEQVQPFNTPQPNTQALIGFVNDAYESLPDEYRPYASTRDALLKKPIGVSDLVASLQRVQEALKKNGMELEDTVSAVASLMKKPEFRQVLAVHNKVQEVWCFNSPPSPISVHVNQIVQECLGSLYNSSIPESAELVELLTRVDIEGVLYAHDKIAERERLLLSSETPMNLGESVDELIQPKSLRPPTIPEPQPDDHIKVVRLEKTQDPLGATVRNEGDAVIIGRIVKGGAAEKSGLLREGDEVLEVNGIEMRGKSVNEVCDILNRMVGTLTFLIIPDPGNSAFPPTTHRRDILIHVRAHFDYDPEDDIYVPCRELGIAFSKGDVLHVISQDDPNWWQAHREGEEDQALAGLIPSKSFQEQREAVKQTLLGETETREKSKRGTLLLCAKTHKRKKKKIPYSATFNDDFDAEEIPTYEEVSLYYPRASFKRPVVLIGPPNIGRHELRQRLMHESDRFAAAVPHTSRSRKDGEVDCQDYHFITRAQFEADILGRKFVEHGEFEKAYYGTSLDAIRSVVNLGRICVLNLHPQSLKILRNSDLKPYIVFVAPPPLERLKQLRISRGEAFKEDELIGIIEKAREMEDKYGHYFDLVIINNDIERTYHDLMQRINYIEREPQWVPSFWLKQ